MANPAPLFVLALAAAVQAPPPAPPVAARTPPAARRQPVVDTYHGVKVVDPYRWLEDGSSPEVRAWSDAENAYARDVLDALPAAPELRRRIGAIFAALPASYHGFQLAGGTLFAFASQPPKQQPFLVALPSSTGPEGQRVLVDPNALDPTGATTIDWFVPSPDGQLLAPCRCRPAAARRATSTSTTLPTAMTPAKSSRGRRAAPPAARLAWAPDGGGFFYTRYPRAASGRRRTSTSTSRSISTASAADADDRYEIGRTSRASPRSQLRTAPDSASVLATAQNGDGGRFAHFLRGADGAWKARRLPGRRCAGRFGPAAPLPDLAARRAARQGPAPAAPRHAGRRRAVVPEGEAPRGATSPARRRWCDCRPPLRRLPARRPFRDPRLRPPGAPAAGAAPAPGVAVRGLAPVAGGDACSSRRLLRPAARLVPLQPGGGQRRKTGLSSTSPVDFSDFEVVREFAMLQGWHAGAASTSSPQGHRARRQQPHPAHRLRRLRHQHRRRASTRRPHPGWSRAASSPSPTCAAAASTARTGTRPACSTNKQNVFDDFFAACAAPDRRRLHPTATSWRSRAAPTAAC